MKKLIFALAIVMASPVTVAAYPTDSHLKAVSEMLVAARYMDSAKAQYRKSMTDQGHAETPADTCRINQFDDPEMVETFALAYAHYVKESDAKLLTKFYNANPYPGNVAASDIDPATTVALTRLDHADAAMQKPHELDGVKTMLHMLDYQNCKG